MPEYCFSDKDGNVIMQYFHMKDVPKSVNKGGIIYKRDFTAEHTRRPQSGIPGWPIECVASGVNAEQAGELRSFFKKNGMNVEVSKDGNPIYENSQQRRKALKLRNFIDKSSYY